MQFDEILAPTSIEGDTHNIAGQALVQTKKFMKQNPDIAELKLFLLEHLDMEIMNTVVTRAYAGSVYHSNVVKAAEIRRDAYTILLERVLRLC